MLCPPCVLMSGAWHRAGALEILVGWLTGEFPHPSFTSFINGSSVVSFHSISIILSTSSIKPSSMSLKPSSYRKYPNSRKSFS